MLSREDKNDIKEMLEPMAEAAKSQAESIEKQTEHMGKVSERMARVEEKVEATQKVVENQMKHCHEIHQDLYDKVNPLPKEIATVKGVATEANDRSKWLRYVLVGILVSIALAVLGYVLSMR